ncbi:DUF1385 domain-containing protein [Paenalkalicoccus suaedae]|uniref:DUF1385 domain-containing protein n=1 Tax=Paenalkalicoccus suaedae TaxID=2592382 RepID=A0A859FCK7_9BACI|nr:DUF1385 domain-containing protein [Paenalkalicoccus suaedae]QKS70304.1 DUF1385 domain-containing protein [Paenalkalicoccus suaedae]
MGQTKEEPVILGGMAHADGVTFFSESHQVKAFYQKDGGISVSSKELRPAPQKLKELVKIPVFRGYVDALRAIYINWVAGLLMILFPFGVAFGLSILQATSLDQAFSFLIGIASGLALPIIIYIFLIKSRTNITKFHGAEHIIHNLHWHDKSIDSSYLTSYRFHKWCGSSWIAIFMTYMIVMSFLPVPPIVTALLWFAFYGELTMNEHPIVSKLLKPIHYIGFAFQLVTTSKPKDYHLSAARKAAKVLLAKERKVHVRAESETKAL